MCKSAKYVAITPLNILFNPLEWASDES